MITVYLGVASLLVWVGFELVFRVCGEASSWRGDARDRAITPLLLVAFAVAAILPAALRAVAFGSVGDAAWAGVVLSALGLVVRAWGMQTLGGAEYAQQVLSLAGHMPIEDELALLVDDRYLRGLAM